MNTKSDLNQLGDTPVKLDEIDEQILTLLQADCKQPLADIGEHVGLSAPSVLDRVRKLEQSGVITGYHARIDAHKVGLDSWAIVGVSIASPKHLESFVAELRSMDEVLECHHVTGEYTMLIKIKTKNNGTLEALLQRVRMVEGVGGTETMIVFSTVIEKTSLPIVHSAMTKKRKK